MVQSRVIPCLLLKSKGLVKGVEFKNHKYLGDPINAVKIFNDKEVDEIIFLDIDATVSGKEPDYSLLEQIASECFSPLCYGGGVKTLNQARKIFGTGVEKVALDSVLYSDPGVVGEIARIYGNQAVVGIIDIKKSIIGRKYTLWSHGGRKRQNVELFDYIKALENAGIGELVINSISLDGKMSGYDVDIMKKISEHASVPVIALGGAGTIENIRDLLYNTSVSAAAAGSMFVFQGVHRAVLISYPSQVELDELSKEKVYG